MKKIKFMLITLLALTFSCESVESNEIDSKEEVVDTNKIMSTSSSSNITDLYNQIVGIDDTNEQILVASALTSQQMYEMWLVKINNYRANNSLTTDQMFFLSDLENTLTPNLFVSGSSERTNFDFDGLMAEAQGLFGDNEGWYFLSKVENINHRIATGVTTGVGFQDSNPIESCDCNKNSNCVRLVGISIDGLSWEYGKCNSGGCYRSEYLWGLYKSSNTGLCTYD